MAKQINVSVGGVVKKVKEVPMGIGGVVKKAKKGVCGVGGVVREFYNSELVIYDHGTNPYGLKNLAQSSSTSAHSNIYLSTESIHWNECSGIKDYNDFRYTHVIGTDTYPIALPNIDDYSQVVITADTHGNRVYSDCHLGLHFYTAKRTSTFDSAVEIAVPYDGDDTAVDGARDITIDITDSIKSSYASMISSVLSAGVYSGFNVSIKAYYSISGSVGNSNRNVAFKELDIYKIAFR